MRKRIEWVGLVVARIYFSSSKRLARFARSPVTVNSPLPLSILGQHRMDSVLLLKNAQARSNNIPPHPNVFLQEVRSSGLEDGSGFRVAGGQGGQSEGD